MRVTSQDICLELQHTSAAQNSLLVCLQVREFRTKLLYHRAVISTFVMYCVRRCCVCDANVPLCLSFILFEEINKSFEFPPNEICLKHCSKCF